MKATITNDLLNSLEANGKTQFVWDVSQTGFGVRMTPKGTASYITQVKAPGKSKPNPKTIGRVGEINLREARKLARKMMAEIVEDSSGPDVCEIDQITFDQAWAEYIWQLLIEHDLDPEVDVIPNRWPPDVMQKRVTYRRLARDGWGERKLSEITYKEIYSYLQDARIRSPSSALQTKNHLSSLYNFHREPARGNVTDNPLKNIKGWPLPNDVYALTEDEAIALTNLLDEEIQRDPIPMSFVKFRMAVGGRVTDIAKLRWKDDGKHNCVNLKTGELHFREHKTKKKTGQNKTIALTDAGHRVLLEMQKRGLKHPENPHIFWSDHRLAIKGHIDTSNVQKKFRRLAKRLAQAFDWSEDRTKKLTQYNLRHTFATLALDVANLSIVDVKNQLMHKHISTTMKYVDATKVGRERVKDSMKKLNWM